MPAPPRQRPTAAPIRCLFAAAALLAPQAAAAAQGPDEPSPFPRLRYPRDAEYVIAVVDGVQLRLNDLVNHIDARHYPGFSAFLSGPDNRGTAAGARLLESDYLAPWVRHYADITALRRHAKAMSDFDADRAEAALSAALKECFQAYLDEYVQLQQQQGNPTELSQDRVNGLLSDYQLRFGLQTEVQGWLDYLCPLVDWTAEELRDFFHANVRVFGGAVTLAHILVHNRDPGTGILLHEKARIRAAARLAEIEGRLREGVAFATVAQLSEDTVTAGDGGVLENVQRFDYRMPPEICRVAWQLEDGEVSDVIETRFGWHIVKRIQFNQNRLMLFTNDALPAIRMTRQRMQQEDLLFRVREEHLVELRL